MIFARVDPDLADRVRRTAGLHHDGELSKLVRAAVESWVERKEREDRLIEAVTGIFDGSANEGAAA